MKELKEALEKDKSLAPIYADWLEENGEPIKASLIRIMATGENYNRATDLTYGFEQGTSIEFLKALLFVYYQDYERIVYYQDYERISNGIIKIVERNKSKMEEISKELAKKRELDSQRIKRLNKWKLEASEGNILSALAHPQARAAICRLAVGEKPEKYKEKASEYLPRKHLQEAKKIISIRQQRRRDRLISINSRSQRPNRIHQLWINKLHNLALKVGYNYHNNTHKLFQSKYGKILYGRGGQVTVDRERYSKGYHSSFGPFRNLNGGARLDNEIKPTCIIIENFRGTEVVRIKLSEVEN